MVLYCGCFVEMSCWKHTDQGFNLILASIGNSLILMDVHIIFPISHFYIQVFINLKSDRFDNSIRVKIIYYICFYKKEKEGGESAFSL